jgi:hypothetical protein
MKKVELSTLKPGELFSVGGREYYAEKGPCVREKRTSVTLKTGQAHAPRTSV